MLALKREPGQVVNLYVRTTKGPSLIGSVMLVACSQSKATLGFELSPEVVVVRREIDDGEERKVA